MNNMFMRLQNTNINIQSDLDTVSRSIDVDVNTIYPFMCQTIIGSRKPCRILTKKMSELKNINTVTGGTTSTIDSSFTNRQRYSHYSKNTQKYASRITIVNPPKLNDLQGIQSFANSITIQFSVFVNTHITYYIVVTHVSTNIIVHKNNFRNTDSYTILRLQPSTEYHISITATDYLGQQTTTTLNKSTTDIPFDASYNLNIPPYVPLEFVSEYNSLGSGN